jgi:hypothetical protein
MTSKKNNHYSVIVITQVEWNSFDIYLFSSDFTLIGVVSLSDKSTDLDIPLNLVSTDHYRATLGHKACHSFKLKNAKFKEFFHPRYILSNSTFYSMGSLKMLERHHLLNILIG